MARAVLAGLLPLKVGCLCAVGFLAATLLRLLWLALPSRILAPLNRLLRALLVIDETHWCCLHVALPDAGSPQSFITCDACDRMKRIGAASTLRDTAPPQLIVTRGACDRVKRISAASTSCERIAIRVHVCFLSLL